MTLLARLSLPPLRDCKQFCDTVPGTYVPGYVLPSLRDSILVGTQRFPTLAEQVFFVCSL